MTIEPNMPFRMPTSRARDRLSEIVLRVQDRYAVCFLTRYGKPVAAVVSMEDWRRIDRQAEMEGVAAGRIKPGGLAHYGPDGMPLSAQESAEIVQKVQYDRMRERETLSRAGLDPVPGGELEVELTPPPPGDAGWTARLRRRTGRARAALGAMMRGDAR
jgi:prevent-host-death family protein